MRATQRACNSPPRACAQCPLPPSTDTDAVLRPPAVTQAPCGHSGRPRVSIYMVVGARSARRPVRTGSKTRSRSRAAEPSRFETFLDAKYCSVMLRGATNDAASKSSVNMGKMRANGPRVASKIARNSARKKSKLSVKSAYKRRCCPCTYLPKDATECRAALRRGHMPAHAALANTVGTRRRKALAAPRAA